MEFNGADNPVIRSIPDFIKALSVDHARQDEVMLAYEMNGAPLPLLNGYPLRLIVPGYYGTYWVKHLTDITLLEQESQSYFMQKAYRVPDNDCTCTPSGQPAARTRPIGRLNVRSFITNVQDGQKLGAGRRVALRGIAFDGGSGIAAVEVSTDGGKAWAATTLGHDHGSFGFREWSTHVPLSPGDHVLMARARSRAGELQPMTQTWNPPGYMRNVVEAVRVMAA